MIGYYGRTTRLTSWTGRLRTEGESLISIINSDPGVSANASYQAIVGVTVSPGRKDRCRRPCGYMSMSTIENIKGTMESSGLSSQIDVKYRAARPTVTPRTMQDRLKLLRTSRNLSNFLSETSKDCQMFNLVGKGNSGKYIRFGNRHQQLQRRVGQRHQKSSEQAFRCRCSGIEVGGQEADSHVFDRGSWSTYTGQPACHRLKPVTIKAVGDPEVPERQLGHNQKRHNRWGESECVEKSDNVSLSTYRFQ